jgi:hypothetical protein
MLERIVLVLVENLVGTGLQLLFSVLAVAADVANGKVLGASAADVAASRFAYRRLLVGHLPLSSIFGYFLTFGR